MVLLIVALMVLLIMTVAHIMNSNKSLSKMTDSKTLQTIKAEDMAGSDSGSATTNFTYSIWFYVDDWNYRYGEPKILFARSGKTTDATNSNESSQFPNNEEDTSTSTSTISSSPFDSSVTDESSDKTKTGSCPSTGPGGGGGGGGPNLPPQPCPAVIFGPIENSMTVMLTCYNGQSGSDTGIISKCEVPNFPLQKWTFLLISVYGRALDVYIDGKLVKTCMLPGVPKVNNKLPVVITPVGGFSGWTSAFQYLDDATNPQEAWNMYKEGYGESFLGSILSKYTIKLSMMDGDTETSSISI